MIAIKNSLASEKLSTDQPDYSLTCRLKINILSIFISVFYKPPKGSGYRYTQEDFGTLLSALPKNSTATICGDLNFPNTNWHNFSSEDTDEQEVLELFENNFFLQSVGFNTRENNILDVAFYRNCYMHSALDEKFTKTFNCSDHKAISFLVECPHTEMKPTIRNFRSFGRADYSEVNKMIKIADFKPVCYTSINNMCEEMFDFFDKVAQTTIPKRTRHRQSLPPWITPSTSNLMKKLNTQRKLVANKPMSYRKNIVRKLQNVVTEAAEIDRCNYQEKIMSTRDTSVIFKHLKSLNKSPNLPKVLINGGRSASNIEDKVNLLNDFFHSVYTPKHSFSIEDINSMNPTLTNFCISKQKINQIQSELDITKTRGPNGYPPIFYQKTAIPMTDVLYLVFKNMKRLRKIPDQSKIDRQ